MSTFNESDVRRQKAGQPTGGQFAEKERAASGLALTGQAGGLPAPGSEEAEPWNYDGDDVDGLAARDGWTGSMWEKYYDARAERELEEAYSAPIEHDGATAQLMTSEIDGALLVQIDTSGMEPGRKVRVALNDGEVYDGDPEADKTIDQALQQAARTGGGYAPKLRATMAIYRAVQEQIERMSAGLVAQVVRERYPDARYVILEPSDQGDYWEGTEIVGDDRENIGEWEDIAEDYESEEVSLSNFDSEKSYPFIVPVVAGRTCYFDLDEAAKYAAS
mgnify:CR=1 FL=1